jgi:phage-related protein
MQSAPAEVDQAFVSVKVITTRSTPDDFSVSVTRATNTQNQVVPQDFAALDKVQWQIREDFSHFTGQAVRD